MIIHKHIAIIHTRIKIMHKSIAIRHKHTSFAAKKQQADTIICLKRPYRKGLTEKALPSLTNA
jgi:hypothetical protein